MRMIDGQRGHLENIVKNVAKNLNVILSMFVIGPKTFQRKNGRPLRFDKVTKVG